MILDMKSYLYQIYMYTISHPQVILVALGIWFILCGFMEWKGKAKKGKNIVFIIWKALVWLGLSGCVIMFLYVTLCNRYQAPDLRYKLQIFWSYREVIFNHNQFILWQIIWNIIAFVPMGNALYYLLDRTEYSHGGDRKRKFYKVVLSCGIFSAGIELIQLFFRIGLFEFDDIVHNTLGAVIGYGIAEVGKRFLTFVAGK